MLPGKWVIFRGRIYCKFGIIPAGIFSTFDFNDGALYASFCNIHNVSILVCPKIGPKEGICPLFWDQKFSPKKGLYFWTSYTQGSPFEFNLDYLGIF